MYKYITYFCIKLNASPFLSNFRIVENMSWSINPAATNFVVNYLERNFSYPNYNNDSTLDGLNIQQYGFSLLYFVYENDKISLNHFLAGKEFLALKDTYLGKIQKMMSSKDYPESKRVNKEYVGIVAFLLRHTVKNVNSKLTNLLEVIKSDVTPDDSKPYIQAIFNAVYIASTRSDDFLAKLKDLEIFNDQDDADENTISAIEADGAYEHVNKGVGKTQSGQKDLIIEDLLIKDVLYPTVKSKSPFRFTKKIWNSTENTKSAKLKKFLKENFKHIKGLSVDSMNNYNELLAGCNPNYCTLVREDDDVLGTPFVAYTMRQMNQIFNIQNHCFSIPYLTTALFGTRGRLEPVLKGATLDEYSTVRLAEYMSNYYTINVAEIENDIDPIIQHFTVNEKNILKDNHTILFGPSNVEPFVLSTLLKTSNSVVNDQVHAKQTSTDIFNKLNAFFLFMLKDFDQQVALQGIKEIYIATNGLILDVIGLLGYICLSDNVNGGENITNFLSAGPALQDFLTFMTDMQKDVPAFQELHAFKANGDSLGQIIKDIPSTCIHGIGFRMLAFYLGCFSRLKNLFKNEKDVILEKLVFVPKDYGDLSNEEKEELVVDLLKDPPFFKIVNRNDSRLKGVYYYTAVHKEFDGSSVPNAKTYSVMKVKQDGTCGDWSGRVEYRYDKLGGKRLDLETIMLTPKFKPNIFDYDGTFSSQFMNKNMNILNIAEIFQDQRVNTFKQLLEHTKNVIDLIAYNRKGLEMKYISEPILYKNIAQIHIKDNKEITTLEARPIDMVSKLAYLKDTENASGKKIEMRNTIKQVDIMQQALKYRLIDKILHPPEYKFLYYNKKQTSDSNVYIVELRKMHTSLENAYRTFHKSSTGTDYLIFNGLEVDLSYFDIEQNLIKGTTGMNVFFSLKRRETVQKHNYKETLFLIIDTIQNINILNFGTYLFKLYDHIEEVDDEHIQGVLEKLKNEITLRALTMSIAYYEFLYNSTLNLTEYKGIFADEGTAIFVFYSTYMKIMHHINPECNQLFPATQHLHIDYVENDYLVLEPLVNVVNKARTRSNTNEEKSNTSLLDGDNVLRTVYNAIPNSKPLLPQYELDSTVNPQEAIPTKLRLLQQAIVAEKVSVKILQYEMYKQAFNDIYSKNNEQFKLNNNNIPLPEKLRIAVNNVVGILNRNY